ncbi:MAG: hypothetical protein M1826_007043 [Phylliscum demangeonii]|nr:MAG: hypothetical protein M1826_007043 [Phylliscum demangeonii]
MFGIICTNRPVQTSAQALSATQFLFSIAAPPRGGPAFNHIVVFLLPEQQLAAGTGAAVYIRFPARTTTQTTAAASPAEFRFLGAIGNEKPSAIFRVRDSSNSPELANDIDPYIDIDDPDAMVDSGTTAPPGMGMSTMTMAGKNATMVDELSASIALGISIEPLDAIAASLATLASAAASASNTTASTSTSTSTALIKAPRPPLPPPPPSTLPAPLKVQLARRIIQNAFDFLASFSATTATTTAATAAALDEEMVPLRAFRAWWAKFEAKMALDPAFLERDD